MTTTALLTDRQSNCADRDYCSPWAVSLTIIEVQRPTSNGNKLGSPGSIGMLVGPRGSRALEQAKARLQSGGTTLADVMAQPNDCARTGNGHSEIRFTLKYLRHTILDLIYPLGARFCVAKVPYSGGELSPENFCVEQSTQRDANLLLEPVVVIDPPVLSNTEATITAAVPSTLGASQWIGAHSKLMIMDEGWAVGGYLAKVAVARLRRNWQESDSAPFTAQADKQATGAAVNSWCPNLALSADRLLNLYRNKVMADKL